MGLFKKEENDLLNVKLCKKCGGKCCELAPCILSCDDLDFTGSIVDEIRDKDYCIVPVNNPDFYYEHEITTYPYLYVRGSSIYNHEHISLIDFTGTCSHLTSRGCNMSFKDRPAGGKLLIPDKNRNCHYPTPNTKELLLESFSNYQKDLTEAAEVFTGCKINEETSRLYDLYSGDEFECDTILSRLTGRYTMSYLYCKLAEEYGVIAPLDVLFSIKYHIDENPEDKDHIIDTFGHGYTRIRK